MALSTESQKLTLTGELGMAYLEIDLPGGQVYHHPLHLERTTIGRSSRSDLVISDLALSRNHAVLVRRNGEHLLEDAGSRNGTFVNQKRVVAPVKLEDGDRIRFGDCRAYFSVGHEPPSQQPVLASTEITWTDELRDEPGEGVSAGESRPGVNQQLILAREIQRFLLPARSPAVPGYSMLGDTQPCYEVGGDFFDYCERGDGTLGLVVGDVARKGFGAALLGHYTQALFRTTIIYEKALENLFSQVNRDIYLHSPPNQFVSACLCVLDPGTGEVSLVNAGHCPPLVVHPDSGVERLENYNLLLGIEPDATYVADRTRLRPGSTLALYSDGITECQGPRKTDFGEEGLSEFLASRAASSPERLMRDLEEELDKFTGGAHPADDITLLLVQRQAEE
jgi:hypothetical protein